VVIGNESRPLCCRSTAIGVVRRQQNEIRGSQIERSTSAKRFEIKLPSRYPAESAQHLSKLIWTPFCQEHSMVIETILWLHRPTLPGPRETFGLSSRDPDDARCIPLGTAGGKHSRTARHLQDHFWQ
jgi:hypothetical protein